MHAAETPLIGPIDRQHLAKFTMGDRALELEVLQLFAQQAVETVSSLRSAADAKAWHIAAHTLKGSARYIGAFPLADAAEEAEKAGHDHARRDAMVARVEALLAEARGYIATQPATP